MPSSTLSSGTLVPTIDIAPFLADPRSAAAERVVDQVRSACRKTGFFQIIGHGLPENLQQELFKASRQFFALGLDEKKTLDASTTIGHRGYDVLASQAYDEDSLPDLKEGFFMGHDVPEDDPNFKARRFFMGQNKWPSEAVLSPAAFRKPVEAYFQAVHALALRVLGLIERTLPYGPGIFDKFTEGYTVAVLRCLHYPPVQRQGSGFVGKKKQLGAGEHTDFGAITLLLQDENAGLEVLDPNTNQFVPVDPQTNTFVFNVGDMLSFWTGGAYKSSVHRVINKAPVDRYSAAFFYDGALDCALAPLDGSGNGEEITVEKHMLERMARSYGPPKTKV